MGLVKSTVYGRHDLVNAAKMYGRVLKPYSDALTGMLGDAAWVAPTLTNSWANAGTVSAGYRVRDGVLRLRGTISGGTVSGTSTGDAFTLPTAYCPDQQTGFVCPAATGFVRVDVLPTGEVRVVMKGNSAGNTSISLDKIAIPLGGAGPATSATFPNVWPMTASPIPDLAVANSAEWYHKLHKPTNDAIASLEGDDSGWVSVVGALSSSWVAYGSGLIGPQWRKRRGIVYARGWVKNGTAGPIMNFGVGLKPAATSAHLVAMDGAGAVGSGTEMGATSVYMASSGLMTVNAFQYGGNSNYLSLAGLSWVADGG